MYRSDMHSFGVYINTRRSVLCTRVIKYSVWGWEKGYGLIKQHCVSCVAAHDQQQLHTDPAPPLLPPSLPPPLLVKPVCPLSWECGLHGVRDGAGDMKEQGMLPVARASR